ncbi:MAG: RNA 2',3'-cyclic phosphodiesterase [Deltaproteobacteria bacterium]|nr:MAG: RNA 2',3'-cyclic phosphodiesterase [Deltaproteobacteria bacterium]
MPETIRTFIAFELPGHVTNAIHKIQEVVKAYNFNIRWVRPENIHLTLKFLGNINPADIEIIGRVMDDTAEPYAPFSLKAKGIGVFPGLKRPRVIWIGIGGQIEPLVGLQQNLDEKLNTIGFSQEKRLFKGHLTLGRVKGKIDSHRLSVVLKKYNHFESEAFTAGTIVLYKSDLQPTGSLYTKLLEVAL